MSAFLLLLVKLNLVMGAAIVLVALLRRPLRLSFGAPIAYAIWFLVPIATVASLFPPRVAAPAPVTPVHVPAAPIFVGQIAHSALRVTEHLTGKDALVSSTIAPPASAYGMPDTVLLLFAAWALGSLFMALYLTRLQLRFSAAVRTGEAGPAVLGFFRPRVVTPDGFQEHFTPQEQAAILAHERVHLARQDARINALTALLRCLCWFNPLIHLGARWLRIDQELACDATVVAGAISRRDYASALLKSQMVVMALPLGCSWPGSQHPLIERIALLKRKTPGTVRRLAGVSLVMLAATSAGLGAWAAQPPVAAKSMTAPKPGMALATLPAMVAAPDQTAGDPNQPVASANPSGSNKDADASKKDPASGAASVAPVAHPVEKMTPTANAQGNTQQAPQPATESSSAPLAINQIAINPAAGQAIQANEAAASADPATRLPAAPSLPKGASVTETGAASNDLPATSVEAPPNTAPAVALNDQPMGQPTKRNLSVGPVQAALSTPPATLPKPNSNEPYLKMTCTNNNTVTGRVTSSTTIQIPKFACDTRDLHEDGGPGGGVFAFISDACKNPGHGGPSLPWWNHCPNTRRLPMTVQFANPADASKMPLGKQVTLKGDFLVITQNKVSYLFAQNARVLYVDPFGR